MKKRLSLAFLFMFLMVVVSPAMTLVNCTSNMWWVTDNTSGIAIAQQVCVPPGAVVIFNYQTNWGGVYGTNLDDEERTATPHADSPQILRTNFYNDRIISIVPTGVGSHYGYMYAISPPASSANITVTATNLSASLSSTNVTLSGGSFSVTNTVAVNQVISSNTTTSSYVGDLTAGLETGSVLAAILLGIMAVRRALSLGDAWND